MMPDMKISDAFASRFDANTARRLSDTHSDQQLNESHYGPDSPSLIRISLDLRIGAVCYLTMAGRAD